MISTWRGWGEGGDSGKRPVIDRLACAKDTNNVKRSGRRGAIAWLKRIAGPDNLS